MSEEIRYGGMADDVVITENIMNRLKDPDKWFIKDKKPEWVLKGDRDLEYEGIFGTVE